MEQQPYLAGEKVAKELSLLAVSSTLLFWGSELPTVAILWTVAETASLGRPILGVHLVSVKVSNISEYCVSDIEYYISSIRYQVSYKKYQVSSGKY